MISLGTRIQLQQHPDEASLRFQSFKHFSTFELYMEYWGGGVGYNREVEQ